MFTDVGGPTTSTNKDALSSSGERAPNTKRLVQSNRVDNSISDLSISDMTDPKQKDAIENAKIIATMIFLIVQHCMLLKINR